MLKDAFTVLTVFIGHVKKMKYFFALILVSLSLHSFGCSCGMQPQELEEGVIRAYKNASSVLLAQAVSIQDGKLPAGWNSNEDAMYEGQTTHFSTIESWKGIHGKQLYTQIVTACCMCGMMFEQGKIYLLYLYGPNKDGYFSTSICSRTTHVENAEEEINFLRKLAPNRGVNDGSQ